MSTTNSIERHLSKIFTLIFITVQHAIEIDGGLLQTRIINGTLADWEGTYYQVSVRWAYNDWIFGEGHQCGGTLVSPNVVLTAAHCAWSYFNDDVMNPASLIVVMGNTDRFVKDENTIEAGVSEIIIASEFQSQSLHEDLAILILNQTVPVNNGRIRTIEMNRNHSLADGILCTVSGWGLTEDNTTANKLRVLKVPLINKKECMGYYGEQIMKAGKICAGYPEGGRDSCIGDSGGPLVCNNILVGIVSGGLQCAKPGKPGIYTDIAYYHNRIQEAINAVKYPKPEYHNDNLTTGVGEDITTVKAAGLSNSAITSVNCVLWMFFIPISLFIYCILITANK